MATYIPALDGARFTIVDTGACLSFGVCSPLGEHASALVRYEDLHFVQSALHARHTALSAPKKAE